MSPSTFEVIQRRTDRHRLHLAEVRQAFVPPPWFARSGALQQRRPGGNEPSGNGIGGEAELLHRDRAKERPGTGRSGVEHRRPLLFAEPDTDLTDGKRTRSPLPSNARRRYGVDSSNCVTSSGGSNVYVAPVSTSRVASMDRSRSCGWISVARTVNVLMGGTVARAGDQLA